MSEYKTPDEIYEEVKILSEKKENLTPENSIEDLLYVKTKIKTLESVRFDDMNIWASCLCSDIFDTVNYNIRENDSFLSVKIRARIDVFSFVTGFKNNLTGVSDFKIEYVIAEEQIR